MVLVLSIQCQARPADFIALKDLKNSELLDKFQLTHVIEKLEPISIVQLKGFGNSRRRDDRKIRVKTRTILNLMKQPTNFTSWSMPRGLKNIPDFSGLKVPLARDEIIKKLLDSKKGMLSTTLPSARLYVVVAQNVWLGSGRSMVP